MLKIAKRKDDHLKNYEPDLQMLFEAIGRIMFREDGFLSFSSIRDYAEQCRDEYKKLLFLEVRASIKHFNEEKSITLEMAETDLQLVSLILKMFEYLTPNELLQMYPVKKKYDGEKYDMKDYFYTMNSVNKLDRDRCISDSKKLIDLLWDYQNEDINEFMVCWMRSVSNVRQLQGGMNPMEEFMLKNGVPTYTFHEKEGYMYNRMTGDVTPVHKTKKRKPKYMKVFEGTKEKEQTH